MILDGFRLDGDVAVVSIITILSMAAGKPSANTGPDAAAKAGVDQLTATLATELLDLPPMAVG